MLTGSLHRSGSPTIHIQAWQLQKKCLGSTQAGKKAEVQGLTWARWGVCVCVCVCPCPRGRGPYLTKLGCKYDSHARHLKKEDQKKLPKNNIKKPHKYAPKTEANL